MDNKQPTENIQSNTRVRRDRMTPEERSRVQKGFPTRENATAATPPAANRRPSGDGTIPQYMRRGEVPVRTQKPAAPVKHSDTVTQTRSPAANRAIASGIPTRAPRRPAEDPAEATLTVDRAALTRLAAKSSPDTEDDAVTTVIERPVQATAVLTKEAPEKAAGSASVPAETSGTKEVSADAPSVFSIIRKNLLPIVCSAAIVLAICILLPVSLAAKQNYEPDYDMTLGKSEDAVVLNALTDEQIVGITGEGETAKPIETKFQITLDFFDRDSISVSTSPITLSAFLEKIGYSPRVSDRFPCEMETQLTEDTVLNVDTVLYNTVEESVEIPYEATVVDVQTIPRGSTQVVQNGKNGSKILTYSIEIVNGEETGRTLTSEVVETQPVNEISHRGIGGTLVGNDGKTYSYSYYRVVNATYYNLEGPTYLGYDADESVIAVDPNYIPLGTKVYVKNDKYDFGVRTAADTGSMIKGWEVDIWLGNNNPQLASFAYTGYHYDMRIYYLD